MRCFQPRLTIRLACSAVVIWACTTADAAGQSAAEFAAPRVFAFGSSSRPSAFSPRRYAWTQSSYRPMSAGLA